MSGGATRLAVAALTAIICAAHIGSPDVWFAGDAGPYRVRALVRMPRTVPGPAEVTVGVRGGAVNRVLLQPLLDAGGGANPPVEAMRAATDGSFAARLWWMVPGSHAVRIVVEGALGRGEVLVPVTAVDGRRPRVPLALGALFGGVLALLVAGGVAIVMAAAREGSLDPGEPPDAGSRRRARAAGAVAAAALLLGLAGMGAWWRAADAGFAARAYRPPPLEATVLDRPEGHLLRITIGDRSLPIVPEHGHILHLFLLREPDLDAFAHLHPATTDSTRFVTPLPPLPQGRYRVIAEIVRVDGFPETAATAVELPPPAPMESTPPAADPDDAWFVAPDGDPGSPGRSAASDGTTFVWEDAGPRTSGEDAGLRFAVLAPDGRPARLEPYMGMAGHAIVARRDGGVFVHLHPAGTVSTAAVTRWTGSGETPPAHAATAGPGHVVAFPFGFPSPGVYRVFVQVRREGRVETGAFTASVD